MDLRRNGGNTEELEDWEGGGKWLNTALIYEFSEIILKIDNKYFHFDKTPDNIFKKYV